ncbi:MAG: hypothetical protein EAX96_14200 [Candidatus Lokiarchaeota archaeon]|nr:hypothetical protein [Candidatus Lokiarchaeota archaeon]
MTIKKKKYFTVREIDGRMGIQSPHEGELKTIEKGFINFFMKYPKKSIKDIVEKKLNGNFEALGFDEDYAITLEYFPGVNIHVLYNNYEDDEDEAFSGAELRFLFSGERVTWVPSEDLLSLLESTFDYLEEQVEGINTIYKLPNSKSDLLVMSIEQRKVPFKHLKIEDLNSLASFVGGIGGLLHDKWTLSKNFFPGIEVTLIYDIKKEEIDFSYHGQNLDHINNYAKDQFAIFLMNHCLRFISSTYNIKEPGIIKKIFSFNYQKSQF